jgi:hypothetical protein
VKRYLAAGGWQPFRTPARKKLLDGEAAWLDERPRQHRGDADVVRQELAAEQGIVASLRTVERAAAGGAGGRCARSFASWEALEAHLACWEGQIANERVHGTTGGTPAERFARAEAAALKPLAGGPPFRVCHACTLGLVRRA